MEDNNFFSPNEQVSLEYVKKPDLVFQQERAAIDVQVSTAKMYPRNLMKCEEYAIVTVQGSKEIAESCTYAVPRAGKPIKGPSVHLARIIAQHYGNLRVQVKVVNIELKHVTSQAIAWDLENNTAVSIEVKRSIIKSDGTRFSDDMVTVTGNAANAIAYRNAVFSVVPKKLVDKIHDAAKRKVLGDVKSKEKFMTRRTEILEGFKNIYGVTEQELLKSLGKNSIVDLDEEDLVTLVGFAQSLKDGDSTVDEMFRKKSSNKFEYEVDKKDERIIYLINDSKTREELLKHKPFAKTVEAMRAYDEMWNKLEGK